MKNAHTLNELVNDVEELLAELKDEHGPEVKELRDRIEAAMYSAKAAVAQQNRKVSARVGHYVNSLDAYINHYPRLAFASGALIAGWLGYWAGAGARR